MSSLCKFDFYPTTNVTFSEIWLKIRGMLNIFSNIYNFFSLLFFPLLLFFSFKSMKNVNWCSCHLWFQWILHVDSPPSLHLYIKTDLIVYMSKKNNKKKFLYGRWKRLKPKMTASSIVMMDEKIMCACVYSILHLFISFS